MGNTIGVALAELSPRGKVFVHGEYWDAVSATAVSPVRVIAVQGSRLRWSLLPEQ